MLDIQYSNAGVRAIQLAHNQAHRLGHDHIGTEHLLLGVLECSNRDPVLQGIMRCFGLTFDAAEAAVLRRVGVGVSGSRIHRPDTERLKLVYQNAHFEAFRLGSELVRPRHMLVSLIPASRQEHEADSSTAGVVLAELGMAFAAVREDVIEEIRRQERQSLSLAMSED